MVRWTASTHQTQQTLEGSDQLPDGTELQYSLRTADPAAFHLFTEDLSRRLRSARLHVPASKSDRTLSRYRSYGSPADAEVSTRTYSFPSGEVEVSIRASNPGSHGYLRYHVEAAIAYTKALDVRVRPAAALTGTLLVIAAFATSTGQLFLAAPAAGAALAVGLPAGLNRLAAYGRPISLTRWDVPDPR
ncbi:MAG: hypothetical protein ABEH59_08270 [Halobacteriales archaeon]